MWAGEVEQTSLSNARYIWRNTSNCHKVKSSCKLTEWHQLDWWYAFSLLLLEVPSNVSVYTRCPPLKAEGGFCCSGITVIICILPCAVLNKHRALKRTRWPLHCQHCHRCTCSSRWLKNRWAMLLLYNPRESRWNTNMFLAITSGETREWITRDTLTCGNMPKKRQRNLLWPVTLFIFCLRDHTDCHRHQIFHYTSSTSIMAAVYGSHIQQKIKPFI